MKNEWGTSRKRGGEEEVGDAKQAKVEEEKMEAEVKGKGSLKQTSPSKMEERRKPLFGLTG